MIHSTATGARTRGPGAADLTLPEAVCLCLLVAGLGHGYAIQKACDADGPVGSVWSLNPQLVYRALDALAEGGLARKAGFEQGSGPARTLLEPTRRGRTVARAWVHLPVAHLRDVRSHLLLKLLLGERMGEDVPTLVATHHAALRPLLDALAEQRPRHLPDLWRLEAALAVDRFLEQAAHSGLPASPP